MIYLAIIAVLSSCALMSNGYVPSCEEVDGSRSDPESACYEECLFIDLDGDGNLVAVSGHCVDTGG